MSTRKIETPNYKSATHQEFSATSRKRLTGYNGKPETNGKNGSFDSNGNGVGHTSRLSERIFSNAYLATYVVYSLVRTIDKQDASTQRSASRLMLMFKRIVDIVISVLSLVLLSPLFLLFAILIKLDSDGPVFYTQERIGLNRRRTDRRRFDQDISDDKRSRDRRRENYYGNPFTVYKFRTMFKDAEKKCGPIWATVDDPRITRFGRILRRTRLDELPQLFNVLRGEMAIVGPRPERPYFVRKFAPQVKDYTKRLAFKPGITGLAQVEKGYDSSVGDVNHKLRYDLNYINNWTLWEDIKIIVKTTLVMITGKGAF